MSRESDFASRMTADSTLMATLTGGVFKSGTVGREGITRITAASAFDATTGYLKPVALVKQRGRIPDGQVVDTMQQAASNVQIIEVWLYADGYSVLDTARNRIYTLFQGYRFSDTLEIELVNEIDREQDDGALKGYSLSRMDFAVYSIRS